MMNHEIFSQKLLEMDQARARTLELFTIVDEDDLRCSPGFGYRPLLWHLAHTGVFEAYWILQKLKGDAPLNETYLRLFDPIATPRENSTNLPTRKEMLAFLAQVRERVREYAHGLAIDDAHDEMLQRGYVFDLVLEHERQHQETLLYLLHLLDPERKKRLPRNDQPSASAAYVESKMAMERSTERSMAMIEISAARCRIGGAGKSFAYDNELPAFDVDVPSFRLSPLLVTNDEYAEFVQAGGYQRSELWSAAGWEQCAKEGWTAPLNWEPDGAAWLERTMFERAPLQGNNPVSGVSWYEAEAYACFRHARLPTEIEWERAASCVAAPAVNGVGLAADDGGLAGKGVGRAAKRRFAWGDAEPSMSRCNFNNELWGATPVKLFTAGASRDGCFDMTGNLWEWTSTIFAPYQGFAAFPYEEYSAVWFDGEHLVLKGGSWATSASVLRTSFRNFFRPNFRIAFAGIRLAADA